MSRHHVNILHSEMSPCPWSRHLTLTCETEVRALSSFGKVKECSLERQWWGSRIDSLEWNLVVVVLQMEISSLCGRKLLPRTHRWTIKKPISFPWTLHKGSHSWLFLLNISLGFPSWRTATNSSPAALSSVPIQQCQIPAAPLQIPNPTARPDRSHPGSPTA